ncbi:MAG: hypothetical protein M3M86_05115 [Thermoproteota archaeon]|nr:hypothetical protein [Thermoproteota archaeon]
MLAVVSLGHLQQQQQPLVPKHVLPRPASLTANHSFEVVRVRLLDELF